MSEQSPDSGRHFRLGLFVLAAVVTTVMAAWLLAGGEWRREKIPAYTLLDESVRGLEVGADVKFRGVTIGQVKNVALEPQGSLIRIALELRAEPLGYITSDQARLFLKKKIREGVRCQMQLSGITGLMHIEVDFPASGVATDFEVPADDQQNALFIPSQPSFMVGLTDSIGTISTGMKSLMDRLKKIDFEGIGSDFHSLVRSADEYAKDERLDKILGALEDTALRLRRIGVALEDKDLARTVDLLNEALVSLGQATAQFNQKLAAIDAAGLNAEALSAVEAVRRTAEEIGAEIKHADIGQAARATTKSLAQAEETMVAMRRSLTGINRVTESLAAVLDLIERNPEVFLRGKQASEANIGAEKN